MDDSRELKLELTLDAPRAKIWRCWTESDLLKQWFTPKPWSTVYADLDVRPGGRMNVTMRSPEGEEIPSTGVYLEIVPRERLVTTDAYSAGWLPSEKPFMTSIITLADAGPEKTAYRAVVRHWRTQDREVHEKMGFHDGWTAAARQLEALAKTL
ncbi:MAG TPA: SRPBCC family protein [Nitrospira sp.]|jgi:Uncharacterized conserved protein|nr:SRPBCC family protein [Nitrospira sp.]